MHGSAASGYRGASSRRLPVVLDSRMKWFASSVFWKASIVCSPSFCGAGMRISERVATCGSGSGFRITARSSCGGKGSAIGLMLPESLAPSLREQSRARAWWLKDQAEGRSGVALPDALERKYPRAGHSWPWFWVLRSTRIRPIHGAVSCVAIRDQTFQRAFKRRETSRHRSPPHRTPRHSFATASPAKRLRHWNRAGSARPFRRLYDDDFTHVLKVERCRVPLTLICRPHQ